MSDLQKIEAHAIRAHKAAFPILRDRIKTALPKGKALTMAESPLTNEEIAEFVESGDLSDQAFERCYEFYLNNGEMPYGTAKARDGDPLQWVHDKLSELYC